VASEEFDGLQWVFLTSGRTHHELYVDTPGEPWRRDPTLVASAAPLEL
jgi:hypothetical protein